MVRKKSYFWAMFLMLQTIFFSAHFVNGIGMEVSRLIHIGFSGRKMVRITD
jgi:hypothetical protein